MASTSSKRKAASEKVVVEKKAPTAPIDWRYIREIIESETVKKIIDGIEHLVQKRHRNSKNQLISIWRPGHAGHKLSMAAWYRGLQTQTLTLSSPGSAWNSGCEVEDCVSHSYLRTLHCEKVEDFKHEGDWKLAEMYLERTSRPATKDEQDPNPEFDGSCRVWSGFDSRNCAMAHFSAFNRSAAAFSWEINNRQSFPEGLIARHRCKTKLCVVPEHIEPGTMQENHSVDRIRDATDFNGEANPAARLTADEANQIFEQGLDGAGAEDRARRFGISRSTVNHIDSGHAWWEMIKPELKARKEFNERQRFNRAQVLQIRDLYSHSKTPTEIAQIMKATEESVRGVCENRTYTNKNYEEWIPLWQLKGESEEAKGYARRLLEHCDEVKLHAPLQPCWIWKREGKEASDPNQYPTIWYGQTNMQARRFAYELFYGQAVSAGLNIHSICGEADCCYWGHLRLGDMKETAAGKRQRGTMPSGENHHAWTVSHETRVLVAKGLQTGESQQDIAQRLGVSLPLVKKIKSRLGLTKKR